MNNEMKDEMCASTIVRQSSRSPGLPSNTPSGQVSPKCDRCIHKYTSGSHYLPRSFSCVRFGSARCRSSLTPRGKTFLSAFRSAGGNGTGEIGLGFLKPGDTLSGETWGKQNTDLVTLYPKTTAGQRPRYQPIIEPLQRLQSAWHMLQHWNRNQIRKKVP